MLVMRRSLVQFAIVLLSAVYLFGPLFESVDRWDYFPQSGNDIVLTAIVVAICFGAALSFIRPVLRGSFVPNSDSGLGPYRMHGGVHSQSLTPSPSRLVLKSLRI